MTEEYFKRIVKANGITDHWANKLWSRRDPTIDEAPENKETEKLLIERCDDWQYYQDYDL